MSRFVVEDDAPPAERFVIESEPPTTPKESPFRTAGRSDPVRGVTSTLQGPAMNWADEGLATVQAGIDRVTRGIPFGQAREQWLDYYRGGADQFQKDNPILAPTLQVGAGIATGMGLKSLLARGGVAVPTVAGLVNPTTTAGRVATAALAGGGSGAIGGAGSADSVEEVPMGALTGAAFGAGAGAAANIVGQGAGAAGRNIVARTANSRIVQDRVRDGGTGSGVARKVEEWADDLARRRLAVALARDGRTPEQVAEELRKLGPDAALVTGGGKNVSNLLDTVATAPGRTADTVEQAIRDQQRGVATRLTRVAGESLGIGRAQFNDTIETLAARRSQDAAPLYERLRQITLDADDELAGLVRRAQSQGADRIARSIAETRGVPFTLSAVSGARPGTLGVGVTPGSRVSMSDLDYLKEGLDDLIRKQTDAAGNVSRQGYALMDLRRQLLTKVDGMTVDGRTGQSLYRQARDAFAGPSALIDAAETGRRVMRMDGTSIERSVRDMTESELQAFRLGAFESIREMVGTQGGQTQLMKMWREPKTQEKLRLVMPGVRTYQEFADAVMGEARRRAQLEGAARGAQTAGRLMRQGDEDAAAADALLDLGGAVVSRDPRGILRTGRNLYGRVVMPEPVRDRIGSLLLTQGDDAQGLLGGLPSYMDAENARRAAAATRSGLLGGFLTNSITQ